MPPRRVKVVNRTSATIHLELRKRDRDGRLLPLAGADPTENVDVFRLGSADDEGIVGAEQPEIELDADVWDRLKQHKAIAGMVKDRTIAVYQAEQ